MLLQTQYSQGTSNVTFANKLDLNGATRTIQVSGGVTGAASATLSGVIRSSSGTAGLIKTGTGNLILSAANTYNGRHDHQRRHRCRSATTPLAHWAAAPTPETSPSPAVPPCRVFSTANQTLSGVISGGGGLIKAYAGTLTLSDSNTYTGKTSLTPQTTAGAGTLIVSSFNSVNGGTPCCRSSLGAPTTVANGTIDFGSTGIQGGATLKYTGPGETTDRVINFLFNGTGATKTLDASGAGLLKFTSTFTGSGSTNNDVTLTGTGNGEIVGGLPFVFRNFTKSGNGTWTLGGTVGNTGTTTITRRQTGTRCEQRPVQHQRRSPSQPPRSMRRPSPTPSEPWTSPAPPPSISDPVPPWPSPTAARSTGPAAPEHHRHLRPRRIHPLRHAMQPRLTSAQLAKISAAGFGTIRAGCQRLPHRRRNTPRCRRHHR